MQSAVHKPQPKKPTPGLVQGLWALGLWALLAACSAPAPTPAEIRLSALHHFEKGNTRYTQEDYAGAIRHYQEALALDDAMADVQYNLGLAHYQTANWTDAALAFQAALTLNPNMADAHYNQALVMHKLYRIEEAHDHYNTYRNLMVAHAQEVNTGAKTTQTQSAMPSISGQGMPSQGLPAGQGGQSSPVAQTSTEPPMVKSNRTAPRAKPSEIPEFMRKSMVRSKNSRSAEAADASANSGNKEKWWTKDLPNP